LVENDLFVVSEDVVCAEEALNATLFRRKLISSEDRFVREINAQNLRMMMMM
tara:strand:- start:43 stop:198 length:156 start_codon:yes stop_codon:yes gene_type:complete